ncbi:MAG TPA: hypothetical protein VNM87_14250, partial [Candidatus Udaeobacter sp.]|nr:hypothetical protein [Candidatus Udaeobacter sp.]
MKISRLLALAVGLGFGLLSEAGAKDKELVVPAGGDLQAAVARATPGTTIRLVAGEYRLSPTPYT